MVKKQSVRIRGRCVEGGVEEERNQRDEKGPRSDAFYDSAIHQSYLSFSDVSLPDLFFYILWIILLVFVRCFLYLQASPLNFAHVHFALLSPGIPCYSSMLVCLICLTACCNIY